MERHSESRPVKRASGPASRPEVVPDFHAGVFGEATEQKKCLLPATFLT